MNLKTYLFESRMVRMIEKENEPWFVGKDVAEILGYSNSSKAVSNHVDLEDKRFEMIAHSRNGNLSETKTAIINESGFGITSISWTRFKRIS
ncbi:BRO-N domain-containing protein [Marinilactibacillus piezotolerans]|uniref:BRO-N domain-containing protein n=1 Tax=Marinilactibacillus piezotolerans TaxID=258723 RepID=UPI0009B00CAF|nr:BRO family protein [Marinilactibacillus piezotolerans]